MAKSPGSPTLILIPTRIEALGIERAGGLGCGQGLLELAGFGPVASAARCAQLIARFAPRRVLLLGIAGTLDGDMLPLGTAQRMGEVLLDGVGAGEGPERIGPKAMGLPQWQPDGDLTPIHDSLLLPGGHGRLLTVCAASASPAQAQDRRERFAAKAEDMEGFAVALACSLAATPLAIIRGISNHAGERDASQWRVQDALDAARILALKTLEAPWEQAGFGPPDDSP